MGKKITTSDFIAKANSIHGSIYDYSKVRYKGTGLKIEINIINLLQNYKYLPNQKFKGVTECFKCDLALINDKIKTLNKGQIVRISHFFS